MVVVIVAFALIILGGAYWLNSYMSGAPQQATQPAQQTQQPAKVSNSPCGDKQGLECLAEMAKKCSKMKTGIGKSVSQQNFTVSEMMTFAIDGVNNGHCDFTAKIEKGEALLSEAYRKELIAKGTSESDIQKQQQELSKTFLANVGHSTTCQYLDYNKLSEVILSLSSAMKAADQPNGKGVDLKEIFKYSKCEGNLF